jgi:NitT/TauT family transport system substrate-binding protein
MNVRRTLLVTFVAALLSGCGAEPVPPMRLGMVPWPGNEILSLAAHRGWLDPNAVKLVEFTGGHEVLRALRNGVIEAASLTLDETLHAAQDSDLAVVIVLDESLGGDAILAHDRFDNMRALKGKRIGVPVNSVSAYVLERALTSAGLEPRDVEIVNLQLDRQRLWLMTEQVDAVVTYEPWRTRIIADGGRELFNSRAIAGEIFDVVVVRRDYLSAHVDRGLALDAAWRRGLAELRTSNDAKAWVARHLQATPAELEQMLSGIVLLNPADNQRLLRGHPPALLASASKVKDTMQTSGLLEREVALDRLVVLPATLARAVWGEP